MKILYGNRQRSIFVPGLFINNKYSAYVIRHRFTDAAEPLLGFSMYPAVDAVATYPADDALITCDAVTANDAVYSDPVANGYTFSTINPLKSKRVRKQKPESGLRICFL